MGIWDRQKDWKEIDEGTDYKSTKIKSQPEKGNPDGIIIESLKNIKGASKEPSLTENKDINKKTDPKKPMKEWIDEKIDFLDTKIGKKYVLFEPTTEFYEKLEKIDIIPPLEKVLENIDKNRPPYVTFDEATKSIEKHLGWSIPKIEFHPLEGNINGGHIVGKIKVGGGSREIQISLDYRKIAKQLGTILAHEIAHDFLFSRGITLINLDENERLTDLTSIMLGLGKLMVNGIEERKLNTTIKLCYLDSADIAYGYLKVNSLNGVLIKNYFTNLNYEAISLVKFSFNEIQIRKAKVKIATIKEKNSRAQNSIFKIKNIYLQINNNQDLINKNISSLKIEPADAMVFVSLNSHSFQLDFDNFIPHIEIELNDANKKLDNEQKSIAIETIETTILHLNDLDNIISQEEKNAERYFEQLLEVLSIQEKYFPKKSSILDNRFQELIKKGSLLEAIKLAKKEDCNQLNNLGIDFAKKKDKIAFEIFEKILILDSSNAIAYYNLGCAYLNFKHYNEAIKNYQMAMKIDPNNVTAYYNCGNAYFNLKQYWEALGDYQMSVQLDPDNRRYHKAIIEVCYILKKLDPTNVKIYSSCGNSYFILEQYSEALENYQMALKLNPDDRAIKENLKKTLASLKKQDGLIIYIGIQIKNLLLYVMNIKIKTVVALAFWIWVGYIIFYFGNLFLSFPGKDIENFFLFSFLVVIISLILIEIYTEVKESSCPHSVTRISRNEHRVCVKCGKKL